MKRFILAALVFVVAACTEDTPLTPIGNDAEFHSDREYGHGNRDLRVLTRNVYVGTDVDVVLAAQNPEDVPLLVAQAFQQLLATNFPERAGALAREIHRTKPHLVGLQEISTVRIQSPGDAIVGGTTPAEDVVFDYLEILMAALAAQGEDYTVVARIQNPDVEIPMVTGVVNGTPTFDDIRLTDYDVILARKGVEVSDIVEQNYAVALPIEALGITIPRGFVAATAHIKGKSYRFVNTHLEPASVAETLPIQLAQADELIQTFATETLPVILVGDLNTHAPTGETYQLLLSAGYIDAWTTKPRRDEGFTCCHDPGLMNTEVNFDRRIDLILARPAENTRFRAPFARVIGKRLRERTPSGLWPSDHGGVWAGVRFQPKRHYADNH